MGMDKQDQHLFIIEGLPASIGVPASRNSRAATRSAPPHAGGAGGSSRAITAAPPTPSLSTSDAACLQIRLLFSVFNQPRGINSLAADLPKTKQLNKLGLQRAE